MDTKCTYIPYKQAQAFSNIVIDYLQNDEKLTPFFAHPRSLEGIQSAIGERKNFPVDRELLVTEIRKQYKDVTLTQEQENNLQQLLSPVCFTICTAHQPNIFTGHLYFIYKILHSIKLADHLKQTFPTYSFVPVYYMGSEDADLDELGHIMIDGKEYKWNTKQTGAVGRMKVDKAFIQLINEMEGQLSIHHYGNELISLFRSCYQEGTTIQEATFMLVNELFKDFGLLQIVPDNAELKRPFNAVVKQELTEQFSYPIIQRTSEKLGEHYKVQAGGREINLFYLIDDKRERIEKHGDNYIVVNTSYSFTTEAILKEVDDHPERFSANVILRAAFQEMLLPNIAFIGGGGELAYWLELKEMFRHLQIPFPILVLRNSFLLVKKAQLDVAAQLGFSIQDLFSSSEDLVNKLVDNRTTAELSLAGELQEFEQLYNLVKDKAGTIDSTLNAHVSALHKRHLHHLTELEKKMHRAEKRKYADERRQIEKLKQQLFPGGLQERIDNFTGYYARHGKAWLNQLYTASLSLEQQFCILQID